MGFRIERIEAPSDADIAAIGALVERCNAADGTGYRYENDDDFRRDGEANTFLLRRGAELAAAATIFAPRPDEGEVTAYTAPDARRRGYFGRLIRDIEAEFAARNIGSILFVSDRRSDAGKAAIEAQGAHHAFAEYAMEWLPSAGSLAHPLPPHLTVRPTGRADVERFALVNDASFGDKDGAEFIRELMNSAIRAPHTIVLDGYVIGMISAIEDTEQYYIHGFCIDAAYRGKGYGAAVLGEFVRRLNDRAPEKTIRLEVETENESALSLYTRLGFSVVTVFDYYRRPL